MLINQRYMELTPSGYSINQQPLFWANSAEKLNALFHNQERELIPGLRCF